jgi:hypothetical protein
VLGHIRQLYEAEAEAKKIIAERKLQGADADAVRFRLRLEKALRIVTSLCQWLEQEQPHVLSTSPIGQAIAYALRHWQALARYLGDGFWTSTTTWPSWRCVISQWDERIGSSLAVPAAPRPQRYCSE